jgi:hypothetical protein
MVRYQLTRALAFLWVRAGGLNSIRFTIPAAIALIFFAATKWTPADALWLTGGALAKSTVILFAILPGFYLAALAAISTFQSTMLDQLVENPGAKVKFLSKGKLEEVNLTYRIYLGLLFGYMSLLTFCLVFLTTISGDIAKAVWNKADSPTAAILTEAGELFLTFLSMQMIILTLHGIYFLAERMHRPSA